MYDDIRNGATALKTQAIVEEIFGEECSGQVKTDTFFKRNCFSNCAGVV